MSFEPDEFKKRQKELRDEDLVRQSLKLRNVSGISTLKAGFDMDDYVLKTAIAGIRDKNPGISEEDLLQELKKMYENAND